MVVPRLFVCAENWPWCSQTGEDALVRIRSWWGLQASADCGLRQEEIGLDLSCQSVPKCTTEEVGPLLPRIHQLFGAPASDSSAFITPRDRLLYNPCIILFFKLAQELCVSSDNAAGVQHDKDEFIKRL
ncbi:hypothetical protein L209DRAFT_61554 [Thermothelomyces heterothallicus CBS 203.75]